MPQYLSIEPSISIIIASIENIELAVALQNVESIVNPKELGSNPIIEQYGNKCLTFNDHTFPIIDLNNLFQLKLNCDSELLRLLLLEFNNIQFGFFVEEIKEIAILSEVTLDTKYDQTNFKNSYIKSMIKYGERSLLLPNFEKIITPIINKKLDNCL